MSDNLNPPTTAAGDRDCSPGGRLFLGHAGPVPQATGRLSSRVGYTGGERPNPTYHDHPPDTRRASRSSSIRP